MFSPANGVQPPFMPQARAHRGWPGTWQNQMSPGGGHLHLCESGQVLPTRVLVPGRRATEQLQHKPPLGFARQSVFNKNVLGKKPCFLVFANFREVNTPQPDSSSWRAAVTEGWEEVLTAGPDGPLLLAPAPHWLLQPQRYCSSCSK